MQISMEHTMILNYLEINIKIILGIFFFGFFCFGFGNCIIEEISLPRDIEDCFNKYFQKTDLTKSIGAKIYWKCMQKASANRAIQRGSNMTLEEESYIESLLPPLHVFSGSARWILHPNTEHRVRKEYRMMTEQERKNYHRTVNVLKRLKIGKRNRYDVISAVHQGAIVPLAHDGPNFLGWHRIYLMVFENALRQISPTVTIPYWASDLDEPIADPKQSAVWCEKFFGNGNGAVINGPYANWTTPTGPLIRNYGDDGQLFSLEAIQRVLNKTRTSEIISPNAEEEFDIEEIHTDVHRWVGGGDGHIGDLETAADDPVFFSLHAYVDYIWELFREKQARCGINPARDYPNDFGEPQHHPYARTGFAEFRNIDGYCHGLASLVSYQRKPECSRRYPSCGSPYLRCNTRTRTPRCESRTISSINTTQDASDRECSISSTDNAIQNRFSCEGNQDMREWVYIPVEVICVRPPEKRHYRSYPVLNNNIYRQGDIYAPKTYGLEDMLSTENLAKYSRCKKGDNMDKNTGRVTIQSRGLNYKGSYAEFAIMDTRLAMANSMAYIAVKSPRSGSAETILTARDSCGRICKAYCKNYKPGSNVYRPCNGAIRISSRSPKLYGKNYGENVYNMWSLPLKDSCPTLSTSEVSIKFFCDFKSKWPWYSDFVTQYQKVRSIVPRIQRQRRLMPSIVRGVFSQTHLQQYLNSPFEKQSQKDCHLGFGCRIPGPCQPCTADGQQYRCIESLEQFAVCEKGAYVLRRCLRRSLFKTYMSACLDDFYIY